LRDAIDATVALERLLDARCSPKSSSLYQLRETLAPMQRLVHDILQEHQAEEDVYTVPFANSPETGILSEGGLPEADEGSGGRPIRSRAEAYRRRSEAADYLLRTEPHSPTPYLVKRAVSWGGMTLTKLLREVAQVCFLEQQVKPEMRVGSLRGGGEG
jgi:type VI secretion system protein ImpA